jgi:hypothetical protein
MTERVVRDWRVVTDTSRGRTEAVRTRTGAVVGDVLFFDDNTGGDGSFEDPGYLAPMIALGGENALLIGLPRTGDIDVDYDQLLDGQTVASGDTDLVLWGANSGQMAIWHTPGEQATLRGDGGTGLVLAENNTIAGIWFRDYELALELEVDGVATAADIYANRFLFAGFEDGGGEEGIDVNVNSGSALKLWITNNEFMPDPYGGMCGGPCETVDATGLELWAEDSFDIALYVSGNRFESMDDGLDIGLWADGVSAPSSFSFHAADNTFGNLEYHPISTSVNVLGEQNYTHTTAIEGNRFLYNGEDDYELIFDGDSPTGEVDLTVVMRDNHSTNGSSLIDMRLPPATIPNGQVDITIADNEVEFTDTDAIFIEIQSGPDVDAILSRNAIRFVGGGDAIHLRLYDSGDGNGHDLTITDNTFEEFDGDAVNIDIAGGEEIALTIADNYIRSAWTDDGIDVDLVDVGEFGRNMIAIERNTVLDIDDKGIDIDVDGGAETSVTIADNDIRDLLEDKGVEVNFDGVGNDEKLNWIAIDRNILVDINDDGIDVDVAEGSDTALRIADNDISFVSRIDESEDHNGIEVSLDSVGNEEGNAIEINHNTVHQVMGGSGISFEIDSGSHTELAISDNDLSLIEGDGIYVDFYAVGDLNANAIAIRRNTLEFVGQDGIDVEVIYGVDTDVRITDNALEFTGEEVGDNGIELLLAGAGEADGNELTIARNTIDNVRGDDGIDVYIGTLYFENEQTTLSIGQNEITNSIDGGVVLTMMDLNDAVVALEDNVIENSMDEDGILIVHRNGDGTQLAIADNRIDVSGEDGLVINLTNFSDSNEVVINGNSIALSDEIGINVFVDDTSNANVLNVSGNDVSYADGGIYIYSGAGPVYTYLESDSDNSVTYVGGNAAGLTRDFYGYILVNGYVEN